MQTGGQVQRVSSREEESVQMFGLISSQVSALLHLLRREAAFTELYPTFELVDHELSEEIQADVPSRCSLKIQYSVPLHVLSDSLRVEPLDPCDQLVAAVEELQVFSAPQQNHVRPPEVRHGVSVSLLDGVPSGQVVKPLPQHRLSVVQQEVLLPAAPHGAGGGAEPRSVLVVALLGVCQTGSVVPLVLPAALHQATLDHLPPPPLLTLTVSVRPV